MNKETADESGRGIAREFYGILSRDGQAVSTATRVTYRRFNCSTTFSCYLTVNQIRSFIKCARLNYFFCLTVHITHPLSQLLTREGWHANSHKVYVYMIGIHNQDATCLLRGASRNFTPEANISFSGRDVAWRLSPVLSAESASSCCGGQDAVGQVLLSVSVCLSAVPAWYMCCLP